MAANIFTGAISANTSTAGNWSLGVVPTISDGNVATFDATSPNCFVNTTLNCNGFDCTGYTGTLSGGSGIICNGNVIFSPTMTMNNGANFLLSATCTITSNGKVWLGAFGCTTPTSGAATMTVTLADNWTIGSSFNCASSITSATCVWNGFSLTVGGGLSIFTNGNRTVGGTTNLIMNGTGTCTFGVNSYLGLNLTFNTTGTITIGSFYYRSATLTYTAGTMIMTTSALVSASSTTYNTSTMVWNSINLAGTNQIYSLLSDFRCSGTITFNGSATTTINGPFNIYAGTQVTIANASHTVTGTATMVFNNNAGFTHNSTSTMGLNITFNANITFGAGNGFRYGNSLNTVTYLSGTISNATLLLTGGRFDTSGMTWTSVQMQGTVTMLSNINIAGGLRFTGTCVLNGAFICYTGGTLHRSSNTALTGTGTIEMNGTGAGNLWTDSFPAQAFSVNLNFNLGVGTVTFAAALGYRTGTMKYISGNVDTTTNNNVMTINQAATTLDCAGMTFNSIIFNNTITLNSTLRAISIQSGSGGTGVFNGTAGFDVDNWNFILTGRGVTLQSGLTYLVRKSFTCLAATTGARNTIQSSTTSSTFLNLQYGATQDLRFLNSTWIDSLGGQTIYTTGTISNTQNWSTLVSSGASGKFLVMF